MSVNKIVTKVDGVINKTINFNDLKAGLAAGSHTITVEAYNGATLVNSQTRNFTVAAVASFEAETTSYMNAIAIPDNSNPSIYTGVSNNGVWVLLDNVIKYWKDEGVWSTLDHFHPMCGGTALKHAFNAKNINEFSMAFFGSWVINAQGNKANGSNAYGVFGLNPSIEFNLENTSSHLAILEDVAGTNRNQKEFGANDGLYYNIGIKDSITKSNARIGDDSNSLGNSNIQNSKNVIGFDRLNGTQRLIVSKIVTDSQPATGGMPNINLYYGCQNLNNSWSNGSDRLLGSVASGNGGADSIKIQQGLTMWEEGLGRL